MASKGLDIAPAEPGILPQTQSSFKVVTNREQGLGARVEGRDLLDLGLGEPETNLGQDKSEPQR